MDSDTIRALVQAIGTRRIMELFRTLSTRLEPQAIFAEINQTTRAELREIVRGVIERGEISYDSFIGELLDWVRTDPQVRDQLFSLLAQKIIEQLDLEAIAEEVTERVAAQVVKTTSS